MDEPFQIALEHVSGDEYCQTFRLAFESVTQRLLLQYPEVTGLEFTASNATTIAQWRTRYLRTGPQDEFVLNPGSRISFDLKVHSGPPIDPEHHQWTIQLPAGILNAQYVLTVPPDQPRYDYLGKGSRFADSTPPWVGSIRSNMVQFTKSGP